MKKTQDDRIVFAPETLKHKIKEHWKVLIVDDDINIHTITTSVIKRKTFQEKGFKLIHARSAKEAIEILENDREIMVVLLDVIMETNSAGIDVVDYLRKVQKNKRIRIVIRTAYSRATLITDAVVNNDVNDYREKSDITSSVLFLSLVCQIKEYLTCQGRMEL